MQGIFVLDIEGNMSAFQISFDLSHIRLLLLMVIDVFFGNQSEIFKVRTICYSQLQESYEILIL